MFRNTSREKKTTTSSDKQALRTFGDWSEFLSSGGKIYYYNSKTEKAQWEKPEEWDWLVAQEEKNSRNYFASSSTSKDYNRNDYSSTSSSSRHRSTTGASTATTQQSYVSSGGSSNTTNSSYEHAKASYTREYSNDYKHQSTRYLNETASTSSSSPMSHHHMYSSHHHHHHHNNPSHSHVTQQQQQQQQSASVSSMGIAAIGEPQIDYYDGPSSTSTGADYNLSHRGSGPSSSVSSAAIYSSSSSSSSTTTTRDNNWYRSNLKTGSYSSSTSGNQKQYREDDYNSRISPGYHQYASNYEDSNYNRQYSSGSGQQQQQRYHHHVSRYDSYNSEQSGATGENTGTDSKSQYQQKGSSGGGGYSRGASSRSRSSSEGNRSPSSKKARKNAPNTEASATSSSSSSSGNQFANKQLTSTSSNSTLHSSDNRNNKSPINPSKVGNNNESEQQSTTKTVKEEKMNICEVDEIGGNSNMETHNQITSHTSNNESGHLTTNIGSSIQETTTKSAYEDPRLAAREKFSNENASITSVKADDQKESKPTSANGPVISAEDITKYYRTELVQRLASSLGVVENLKDINKPFQKQLDFTNIGVELKNYRSIVRLKEVKKTLLEQRLFFLDNHMKQIEEILN